MCYVTRNSRKDGAMVGNTTWAEVSCEVPTAMVDALADFLVDLSGGGVSIENRSLDTFSLDTVEDTPYKTVKAYFRAETGLRDTIELIDRFLSDNGPSFDGFVYHAPAVAMIHEEDWANNWKVHFKPTRIGSHLVLKPSWESYAPAATDIVVELDPGMAFGTGTHATTRLCLEAMERIFLNQAPFRQGGAKPQQVLDVGTGSGVLAIAAAKFGAGRVLGIDIDPGAVAVAHENIALNGVDSAVEATGDPLDRLQEMFEVVIANILAEDLVKMAAPLVARMAEGGFLILSGILNEKEAVVTAGFAGFPVTLTECTRQEEWSCLVYRRGR